MLRIADDARDFSYLDNEHWPRVDRADHPERYCLAAGGLIPRGVGGARHAALVDLADLPLNVC